MNISERVQALSHKDVPDRPGRSVRFPWLNGAGKATTVRTLHTPTAPELGSATVAGICRGLVDPYIKVISL